MRASLGWLGKAQSEGEINYFLSTPTFQLSSPLAPGEKKFQRQAWQGQYFSFFFFFSSFLFFTTVAYWLSSCIHIHNILSMTGIPASQSKVGGITHWPIQLDTLSPHDQVSQGHVPLCLASKTCDMQQGQWYKWNVLLFITEKNPFRIHPLQESKLFFCRSCWRKQHISLTIQSKWHYPLIQLTGCVELCNDAYFRNRR